MNSRNLALAGLMSVNFGLGWILGKSALDQFPPVLMAAPRIGIATMTMQQFPVKVRNTSSTKSGVNFHRVSPNQARDLFGMLAGLVHQRQFNAVCGQKIICSTGNAFDGRRL